MADKQVTVLALIRARPGKEREVKAALLALVPTTREERGCLNYDLHQSGEDPACFMFHENWESRAALDAHLAAPHIARFKDATQGLLDGPIELSFWEPSGEDALPG